MEEKRFNPGKLEKLNNPIRLKEFPTDYILKLTGLANPKVIIDLGAGTAFFSAPFARLFPDCKIYTCDISDIMIDWMEKNIVPQYDNIFPMKMTGNQVPLENNVADFIFMVNLHHELDSPEETLRECYRLLRTGGTIAISDWRKEKTEQGPSYDLRCEPDEVGLQLKSTNFDEITEYTDFPNNFLVIAKKPIVKGTD